MSENPWFWFFFLLLLNVVVWSYVVWLVCALKHRCEEVLQATPVQSTLRVVLTLLHCATSLPQVVNNRVVHRSNYLNKYDGGSSTLRYQEAVAAKSWLAAKSVQLGTLAVVGAMGQSWMHPLLKKLLPAPGEVRGGASVGGCAQVAGVVERPTAFPSALTGIPGPSPPHCRVLQGPSRETMMTGYFKNRVVGWTKEEGGAQPSVVQAEVADPHRDGGYWGTSRMVSGAAGWLA